MAYTRVNWENYPNTNTPINATNLNVMDEGIDDIDTRLTTVESDITTLTKYSTTERAIGTWIDGKTIYRKVITGAHNDNEVLVSNVSSLINVYGQADNATGIIRYIPWIEFFQNMNYTITVALNSNNIRLNSKLADVSKPTNSTTKIVIEYTKTTD